jgi:hypothetical protein
MERLPDGTTRRRDVGTGRRLAATRQVIITAARVSSTMGKRIALTSIFKWRIVTG